MARVAVWSAQPRGSPGTDLRQGGGTPERTLLRFCCGPSAGIESLPADPTFYAHGAHPPGMGVTTAVRW